MDKTTPLKVTSFSMGILRRVVNRVRLELLFFAPTVGEGGSEVFVGKLGTLQATVSREPHVVTWDYVVSDEAGILDLGVAYASREAAEHAARAALELVSEAEAA